MQGKLGDAFGLAACPAREQKSFMVEKGVKRKRTGDHLANSAAVNLELYGPAGLGGLYVALFSSYRGHAFIFLL